MLTDPVTAIEQLMAGFAPAGEALLAQRMLEQRRDWKFVLPLASVAQLLGPLAADYQVLLAAGQPLARYENHYFDTADLHCYREHHRGRPRRYKVRVRSYLDRQLSALEVKSRDPRRVTRKRRLAREFGDLTIQGAAAAEFIAEHCPLRAGQLQPCLSNSFRRITLVGVHSAERITLDLDLRFVLEGSNRRLNSLAVVEVKSALSRNGTPVLGHFRRARLRPQGFSKYCVGTALLTEGLRANRFARILRQVARLEEAA
jgi:hypothetical protein